MANPAFVFGPVPSRRLGQSLGVDPVPLKTCNWNCVYCQLGRTVPLTNARLEYHPREAILSEVKRALAAHAPGSIDWVTFVGSGEPTLHAGLGWLIREVKALTRLPVAVITNGALLCLPEVRRDLRAADAVLPSLDAGAPDLYRRINRPWPELTFQRLVDGLAAFRNEYAGRLWIEVMLIQGLNDTQAALQDLAAALRRIGPDRIDINLPVRPPAEPWVRPADDEGLARASAILGAATRIAHPVQGAIDLSGFDNPVDAILSIITRHPVRQEDLAAALERWTPGQVDAALEALADSGRAQRVRRHGGVFWSAAGARYPDPPPG